MSTEELKGKKCRWINISGVDESTETYLKENFQFHTLDIEDVMSDVERPKLDVYKYYLFFVAVFPYYDKTRLKIRAREVDVFLTKDAIITVAKNPHPHLEHIFKKVTSSAKLRKIWFAKGPSFVFYKILEKLYRDSRHSVDNIADQINVVENDVYDNELKSVARDLALLRRSILALRRILDPQRASLGALVNLKRDFIPDEMNNYFDNVLDGVEKIWSEIEGCRDMVDGLHLTNESLISHHTSRVVTTLTIISASLMPLTLLSGIYGMNLSKLPLADQPIFVFALFGLVALLTVALVALIFRSKKV